jgi:uncharacterized protein GlcG (DUF336 family)
MFPAVHVRIFSFQLEKSRRTESKLKTPICSCRYNTRAFQQGGVRKMTHKKVVLMIAVMVILTGNAFAQLPATKVLTMDVAESIAQGAMAKCRADGYKVTVLVVDAMNAPKAMIRDDGATPATAEVAKMKATATMLYNRPSGPATPPPAGQPNPPATIPGTINAQGGVPIKVGEQTIGAVAVSGAPGGDKDAACANAGISKVADKLK